VDLNKVLVKYSITPITIGNQIGTHRSGFGESTDGNGYHFTRRPLGFGYDSDFLVTMPTSAQ
jgi:hypothetical protein